MSTKLAANSFLDVIQKSNLVDEDKLAKLVSKYDGDGVDTDNARALADALVADDVLTTWQVEKLLLGKHKGFFLGPYRMLNLLGKGGMGAVYLAEHEMMKRRCAIKVLPAKYATEKSSVLERFYVEAQAVASLDDPNIVRAYDLNKEIKGSTTIHYLVMEYIQGRDIQDTVNEDGVLDYVTMADFTRQAANGLAHAHDKGLIHRDIKPANLLVDKKGTVKILDLGLARFFDDGTNSSLTIAYNDTVLGTADYLSPEQALNSHEVDRRTDIYSLGCTCYFMLTGRPPFPDGTVAQRLVAHQVKAPEPLTQHRPDIPYDLVAIIEKMMAKDPKVRYRSAEEVSAAMLAWLVHNGSEEWKREHAEMLSDSSVSVTAHEPTRASSSPMSDTELELLPLDEEEEEEPEALPASGDSAEAPTADEEAASVEAELDEIEPVVEIDAAELESSDNNGLLGSLNEPDLMSVLPEPDTLSSSNVLHMETLSSGSSVSGNKKTAGKKPASGTKQQSAVEEERASVLTSPPVLIGVGAGILALVAILLILFMAGDDEPPASPPITSGVADNNDPSTPDPDTPPKPDDEPTVSPIERPKKKDATKQKDVSKKQPKVDRGQPVGVPDVPQNKEPKPDEPPAPVDPEDVDPEDVDPKDVDPKDVDPKDVDPKDNVEPKNVEPKNVEPKDNTPSDPPDTEPPKKQLAVEPKAAKQPVDDPPPPKREFAEAEKLRLFGKTTGIEIDLDLQDKPPSLLSQTIFTTMRNQIEDLNFAKPEDGGDKPSVLKLRLVEETVDKVKTFRLFADVQCIVDESNSVSVWNYDEEIGKLPPGKLQRSQMETLFGVMKRNVQSFADKFSTAYKFAKNKSGDS